MNGQVKVRLHILQDGTGVVSVNGAIIPNLKRITHTLCEGGDQITLVLRDCDYSVHDDRSAPMEFDYTNADHRRLVQEAFDDGRIIEAWLIADKDGTWFEAHKTYWGDYLDWDTYNFRLKGPKK